MMRTLLLLSITLALLAGARAAELTADEIVQKANLASYYGGDDGRAEVKMTIHDADGGTREREFVILRQDQKDGGDQKFFVYFQAPADIWGMAYLVWKHTGENQDDDRWLYTPKLRLTKRIAPGDKRSSFVGSDFFYEDVSGRGIHADKHELVETTDRQYVLKHTPKDPDAVEFSYYLTRIDKETMLPRQAEYFDKKGDKYRVVEALEVKEIEGLPTVVRSKAADLKRGSHTINEFTYVDYNVGLHDRIFTQRSFNRPPREVRR